MARQNFQPRPLGKNQATVHQHHYKEKVGMDWPHVATTATKHCLTSLGLESTGPKKTRETHELLAQDP